MMKKCSILLVFAMLFAALAGCSSGFGDSQTTPSDTGSAAPSDTGTVEPSDAQPSTLEPVPLEFSASGRKVPSWGFDEYGLTGVLPDPWDVREEQVEPITLVPMGAARLRVTVFPPAE